MKSIMVETSIDRNTGSATIVLKPNNSSSWQFNMRVVTSLAFIAVLMSGYFALHGFWLIFPFAVLEVAFVFICLYLRMRANIKMEVITFDKTSVLIERGRYHAEKSWTYHRIWTKFFVKKPATHGYPKKIFICSHGRELELGSFLNKKDKEILIKDLKNLVCM